MQRQIQRVRSQDLSHLQPAKATCQSLQHQHSTKAMLPPYHIRLCQSLTHLHRRPDRWQSPTHRRSAKAPRPTRPARPCQSPPRLHSPKAIRRMRHIRGCQSRPPLHAPKPPKHHRPTHWQCQIKPSGYRWVPTFQGLLHLQLLSQHLLGQHWPPAFGQDQSHLQCWGHHLRYLAEATAWIQ